PKTSKPTFVVELPLATSPSDERGLVARMECGKRISNVVLQHGKQVVKKLRSDPLWAAARKIKDKAKRREAYRNLREKHGFLSSAFDSIAVAHKNAAGFHGRIGTHETQKIAWRVFGALEQHLYGERGMPRFKGAGRPLHSLEGKNNEGMLSWDGEAKVLRIQRGWHIPVILPSLRNEWLWTALQARTKYCRVLWRMVGGTRRWFVQLVQEGVAPLRATVLARLAEAGSCGGLDMGSSRIAWATEKE